MAKKANNNKVEVNTESTVIIHDEVNKAPAPEMEAIGNLTVRELIDYEMATSLICRRYENNIKMYDGSIRQSGLEYEKFKKLNDTHTKILNEIEKRVGNLY